MPNKTVVFTDEMVEGIDKIQQEVGSLSFGETVRGLLTEALAARGVALRTSPRLILGRPNRKSVKPMTLTQEPDPATIPDFDIEKFHRGEYD